MNRDNSLKTGFLNGLVGLYVKKSWASGEIALLQRYELSGLQWIGMIRLVKFAKYLFVIRSHRSSIT